MNKEQEQFYSKKRNEFFNAASNNNNTFEVKKPHVYSAGILPWQVQNNQVYLCLGKDYDGNWSDFGGKCDPKDRLVCKETAAREFYEETYGALISLNGIRNQLKYDKNFTLVNSESMGGIRYYMFVVQIPKVQHAIDRFNKTREYVKYIDSSYQYLEKTDIGWISLDTLLFILENNEKNEQKMGWPLRKVFKRTLLNHRDILHSLKHKEHLF